MNPTSPPRRPLAPTSINAILASPLISPAKSSTPNTNANTSLRLPPISLNLPTSGSPANFENISPPPTLPHLNEAISSALRHPLPAGLSNGTRPAPLPPFMNPVPVANTMASTMQLHNYTNTTPIASSTAHTTPVAASAPSYQPQSFPVPGGLMETWAKSSEAIEGDMIPTGTKRKAGDMNTGVEDLEDDYLERLEITENCDQIRRKIHSLLNSGDMRQMAFLRELGCTNNTYSRFMGQNGPDKGARSEVYVKAWRFFKRREMKGITTSVKRVKKEDEEKKQDVSNIKLEGEETVSVPVYDSCDEIRKKIRAHLVDPTVTQAGFLREIAKTYIDGRKIQSKVLNDFLGKRGKFVGNTTAVYYSSYVFFEKTRIRDGREKTKHRLEMEKEWMQEGGIDTKHRDNGKAYYLKGS